MMATLNSMDKTKSRWNLDSEENDERADDEDRDGVTQPPDGTNDGGIANASLLADDG